MRIVLIDNSTITGIQRLLGQIPVRNLTVADMDILCLENYLQGILFYDRILFLDDYKEEWRSNRANAFPNIAPLSLLTASYDEVMENTRQFYERFVPRVEAGQFTDDDFRPYFEQLKMNVIFTWDMTSSEWFLTQKMLEGVGGVDLEKYSALSASLYDELFVRSGIQNSHVDINKAVLVDSKGNIIEPTYGKDKLSRQASAFFASLNWMSFRTILYTTIAENLSVDLMLHPIRQSFLVSFLQRVHQADPSVFRPLIDAISSKTNNAINTIQNPDQPFVTTHALPLFVHWFAARGIPASRFIEHAFDLRNEDLFVTARQRLIELEDIRREKNEAQFLAEKNQLILEVDKTLEHMLTKYSAGIDSGVSISKLISAYNLTTAVSGLPRVPRMDLKFKQLEFLKHLIPQKGFKGVCRAVVDDLVLVSRLGANYEHITAEIKQDEDAGRYLAKTEQIKFRNIESHSGRNPCSTVERSYRRLTGLAADTKRG